jgi:hypothetical protein
MAHAYCAIGGAEEGGMWWRCRYIAIGQRLHGAPGGGQGERGSKVQRVAGLAWELAQFWVVG